jgi:hypothetical protein
VDAGELVGTFGQGTATRESRSDETYAWRRPERGDRHAAAMLTTVFATRRPCTPGKPCPTRRPSIAHLTYTPGLAGFRLR